ncbi:MAG: FG-GAP-like repeat-containing protein [Bacteroidota bacterium]|uniref:FG-GAP-like repeat-containing protein n=1 Tax=Flagellimonas okinawensis TaxID=3031324 RepID=A0ABT5XIL5_9FLAO|nr:FG-GAP-like repeat-containing protein [[Muricauda] okinawensis]MDF0705706.1 FG-GAP-like repeat-containing protein [[Muricauda] okinawensis]MEC8832495.1 FG-GAP-like repeat-containing protein [Bacteroidota bacterium]
MPIITRTFLQLTLLFLFSLIVSCKKEKPKQEEAQLYNKYCASCHVAPQINELPKEVWEKSVLPAMVARMDVEGMYQDPNELKTGFRPKISLQEWAQLENYILSNAPSYLETVDVPKADTLRQFKMNPFALDEQNGAMITFLGFSADDSRLFYGDLTGKLGAFDFISENNTKIHQGTTPVTWYSKKDSVEIISEVGILGPSEEEKGKLTRKIDQDTISLDNSFHRPVHTLLEDLNGDGTKEIVVSEFGNEAGRLSLLIKNESGQYDKKILLNLPGAIRTVARDMNNDGKMDIVALMTQSNESITIFHQTGDLEFEAKKVLEFSPVYGTSWFELVDYNGDGLEDIVTVQGDNADISYVHKPYHGMRIFINNGKNAYEESFFYPMYGATRVVSRDFDQDGDIDFALVSTFPNYQEFPERTFVYLENLDANNYTFNTNILKDPTLARWFLMDAADIDNDGDEDLVLSSLTLGFTPVPEVLSNRWKNSNVDILVLENLLH